MTWTRDKNIRYLGGIAVNILMVLVAYSICRIVFFAENASTFTVQTWSPEFWNIFLGGIVFDVCAICYTNALYLLLTTLPLHWKETPLVHSIAKWYYLIVNGICIAMNLCDSVYYPYSLHRVTAQVFSEFGNNDNLGKIFGIEFLNHWYLVLLFAVMMFALWRLYHNTKAEITSKKNYYLVGVPAFLVIVLLMVFGIRGRCDFKPTRPINIGSTYNYTSHSAETSIILNTPFSMIRTISKRQPQAPHFFSETELDSIYSPLHEPNDSIQPKKTNVVILIVESFAKEFIGGLNRNLDGGRYKGYTPFIDSFLPQCFTFENTYCNTNTSVDAMPAVLASIPKLEEPFVTTPYDLDQITGIASELKHWGYASAFFHGAPDGSMGFQAFARQVGFQNYFGMEEYDKDKRFHGQKDFDGTWAIWDEEFLQFYALKMSEMKQPFVTACFTASSHHPFAIPERYKDVFQDEGQYPLHKCIKYTDYSIRRFFETASKQPWFRNTIFVITADHASSKTTHPLYKTEYGNCLVPILIYDPSGDIRPGVHEGMMSQFDIMPSLLGYMGYDRPFIAFGRNVFDGKSGAGFGFNWHHIPQFIYGDYFLQATTDGKVLSLHNIKKDPLLKNNLAGRNTSEEKEVLRHFQAFMQSFLSRLQKDDMKVKQ